jgi:hypothetical protein
MCSPTFEWTKSGWGVATRPFTERIWESETDDGTAISVLKSGVNGMAMILAPVACLVMALVTPLFAAFDLVYHPLKECFFPEPPGRLPLSSKAFYDGQALDDGSTLESICGRTNQELDADWSFLYWMFPSHVERDLDPNKIVQGLTRVMLFYGYSLDNSEITETAQKESRKRDLADPKYEEIITRMHTCLTRYGLHDLAESLADHFPHLLPEEDPEIKTDAFG